MNPARPILGVALLTAACGPQEIQGKPSLPAAPSAAPSSPPAVAPPVNTRIPLLPYPETRVVSDADVLHGVTVKDPYRWLEDATSPEVQAWMKAEDALARQEL